MNSEELDLKNSIQSAVTSIIKQFPNISPLDRCAVILEMGEWILVDYEDLDVFCLERLNQGKLSNSQVSTLYMTATTLICVCLLFGNLYWMVGTIFLEFIL